MSATGGLHAGAIAVFAIVAAAAIAALAGLGFAAPQQPADPGAARRAAAIPVDVELVLAVDVSYSMDPEEQALQREGYMAAITSREFLQALKQGMHGRIAMTYFEWAGMHHQQIIVPWRLIDGPEAADGFAADIGRARYTRASRTSISGALLFAAPLFEGSGYRGVRRVIDVSGDGVNNNGPLVTLTRDEVLAKGITINGLPILLKRPNASTLDIEQLDIYYEDCVIGGPGAFVIPIRERDQFKEAIRTKLVLEIAGRTPERRVVPVAGPRRASPAPSASACGRSAGANCSPRADSMSDVERVLIVGGGIAGMALAIVLRRAGIAVEIAEIDTDWRVYGAGITITGPTLRALGRLGPARPRDGGGLCYDATRICDADGRVMVPSRVSGRPLGARIPNGGGILRPVLHRLLSEATRASGAAVRLGVGVAALAAGGRGGERVLHRRNIRKLRSGGRRRRCSFAASRAAVSGRAQARLHRPGLLARGGAAACGDRPRPCLCRRRREGRPDPGVARPDVPVPAAARAGQSAHAGRAMAGFAGRAVARLSRHARHGARRARRLRRRSTTGRWRSCCCRRLGIAAASS